MKPLHLAFTIAVSHVFHRQQTLLPRLSQRRFRLSLNHEDKLLLSHSYPVHNDKYLPAVRLTILGNALFIPQQMHIPPRLACETTEYSTDIWDSFRRTYAEHRWRAYKQSPCMGRSYGGMVKGTIGRASDIQSLTNQQARAITGCFKSTNLGQLMLMSGLCPAHSLLNNRGRRYALRMATLPEGDQARQLLGAPSELGTRLTTWLGTTGRRESTILHQD